MVPQLRQASYRGDYRVWLRFADGIEGEVDLEKELWGEVFAPLKDRAIFAALAFDESLGTIVWPTGADLAPEFLYEKVCERLGDPGS